MSGKRRRPNAYEVSFPEEAEEYRARREGVVASSTSNSRASSVASTSTLKRKNVEEAQVNLFDIFLSRNVADAHLGAENEATPTTLVSRLNQRVSNSFKP